MKTPRKPEVIKTGSVAVKIYQREKTGGYIAFEVADYSSGTRRLRSFADHAEARREAGRIARLLASGESTAAQMRGADAASYGRAIELIRETGLPLELVAARYAEMFKILGGDHCIKAAKFFKERNTDDLPQKPVAEVVSELLTTKEARGASGRYISDLRARLTRFAESFKVNIADVQTGDVQRWLDGLNVAQQTALNFRRVVSTLFSHAEARGYIRRGENPVEATEKISVKDSEAIAIYAPSEIDRLLVSASKEFRPCIAISAFAGLRSAEVERLEWNDIDLKGGFITVGADKAKTASRRVIPIAANLKAWLAPYAQKHGRIWKGTHDDFYDAQQITAAATELKPDSAKGIAGVAPVKWKANGLRHSFASYRLAEVQSAAQVSLECGNSAAVVFKHYRELEIGRAHV